MVNLNVVDTHHFFSFGLAQPLGYHFALGHPLSDALLGLPLLVLRVPNGDVLSPALHTGLCLGGGPGRQGDTTDNEEI